MLRDAVLTKKFQPYALPDARIRDIKTGKRTAHPALFTPRDGIIQRIFAPHDDYISAFFQIRGYIRRKGCKSARMREDMRAVQPYIRLIIGGIEAKQRALALVFFGDRKGATIPHDVVLRSISDAARGVLIGKRHVDF